MQYRGEAEYATIARVKRTVSIPVIANGDIDTGAKAKRVLEETGADALMIGRAAQGRPWIFRTIAAYLETGVEPPEPGPDVVQDILLQHVRALHAFYGERAGVRIARKHLGWYARNRSGHADYLATVYRAESAEAQLSLTADYFSRLAERAAIAA
jgi:tRNA-dihydrouridine synthase B